MTWAALRCYNTQSRSRGHRFASHTAARTRQSDEKRWHKCSRCFSSGVIHPSNSPRASPVVMVKMKDGSLRFCVDFRQLNATTIKDAHPIPRIDDLLDALHGARWFYTLDLKSGYWQVPIQEQDKEKTAFRTSSGQLFEFNQVPFGLCNAPTTFSRLMDRVLAGLHWETCLFYRDNIIVFAATWEEHLACLRQVFERLRHAQLKLGAKKCTFAAKEVTYLGHRVTSGLLPDPTLLKAIREIGTPNNATEVRSFLGLAGYYRRYVKNFAAIAGPLHALTRKVAVFHWNPECQQAFDRLKTLLTTSPITAFPDFNLPFRLYTNVSTTGLGPILAQVQEGKERIICCASRSLNQAEKVYPATKLECLTIVWTVAKFRPYSMSMSFEVYTDHYALQWLKTMHTGSALLHRWSAALEEYDFTVKHRPGKAQTHVDGLSRLPVDPPPPEDTLLQVRLLDDEDEARKIAANCMLPPTSVATLCGSSSVTTIPIKQVAASLWRPSKAAHSANWASIMAIARRRRAPSSLRDHMIPSPSTWWGLCLQIDATST